MTEIVTTKRLCFFSSVDERVFELPRGAVLQDGVEDCQQLAHAGGDHDLERLAGGFQTLGEGAEDRVVSACGQRGHVEHAADRGTPAPDRTFAAEAAAVPVEGRHPHQGGDLLAVDLAQLGQLGEERGSGHRPDARHAPQAIHFVFPVVVGFDQSQDFLLDLIDLFAEHHEHLLNALANHLRGGCVLAVGFGGLQLDQLASADHQLLEFCSFFRDLSDGPRLRLLGIAGKHIGIDPIGLGEDPQTRAKSRT